MVPIAGMKRRARRRFVRKEKKKVKAAIRKFRKLGAGALSDDEGQYLSILENYDATKLLAMEKGVRWQQGLSERFRTGVIMSFEYLDKIKEIFIKEGVPVELSYLPHVESSFNYKAYSKVGAAGIFQFMRSTARRFGLKLNYLVDQRLDPLMAARAAAQLLKKNYELLGHWPLAITAYNHGARGMSRAMKNVGSSDIGDIILKYDGRRFGFASKNFYTSFLAAYEIASSYKDYFKIDENVAPLEFFQINLPKSVYLKKMLALTNMSKNDFREYNLSLRRPILSGSFPLPKGLKVNLPKTLLERKEVLLAKMDKLPSAKRRIDVSGVHVVNRGETLFDISRIYKIALSDLVMANNLRNPSRIYPGMRIKVPAKGKKKKIARKVKENIPEYLKPSEMFTEFEVPDIDLKKEVADLHLALGLELFPAWKNEEVYVFKNRSVAKDYLDLDIKIIRKGRYKIIVQFNETLGHYADWLRRPTRSIRKANGFGRSNTIHLGQGLFIPGDKALVEKFKLRRLEYHLSIEEDFFDNYRVVGLRDYIVKRGDTANRISRKLDIPIWLMRKYGVDVLSANLSVGEKLQLPEVESATSYQ